MLENLFILGVGALGVLAVLVVWVISLRRVVPTNEVHIIQRADKTVSYGKDTKDGLGNTYYEFPSWIPVLGVTKTVLPVSVFSLDIDGYEAYDKDRLPFVVDIKAFFRITDSNLSASRVFSFQELYNQLHGIVQGAVRSILAKENLESIMCERNVYGDKFTQEVSEQLKEWGVETVKNIELMDIRDAKDSCVIANIMKKKKSQIEMESRTTVANNMQKAKEAEILAQQEIELKQQDANKQVGLRQAQVTQEVGIANEKAKQEVQEQTKITTQKEMEVEKVREVQTAEIEKNANIVKAEGQKNVVSINAEANIVKADADKKVQILKAQAEKEQAELKATADLTIAKKGAEGIKATGEAKADAEKQMQLAPVEAQIALAKEIGENSEYQKYLITIEQINANAKVGVEQARNLGNAEIKIFANAGSTADGVNAVTNIFNSQTGTNIASMVEGLKSTPVGEQLINKFLGGKEE